MRATDGIRGGRRQTMKEFLFMLDQCDHPFNGKLDYGGESLGAISHATETQHAAAAALDMDVDALIDTHNEKGEPVGVYAKYPKGAEVVEFARFNGYEPFLHRQSGRVRTTKRRGMAQTKTAFPTIVAMLDDEETHEQAVAYLLAT